MALAKKNVAAKAVEVDEEKVEATETETVAEEVETVDVEVDEEKVEATETETVAEEVETVDVEEAGEVEAADDVDEETVVASKAAVEQKPTAVATAAKPATAGTTIATTSGNASKMLAEMGYEGLEGGFYSQINLKIDNGSFVTSEDDELEEKSFHGVILETKRKYAFSTGNKEEDEAVFSYDGITTTDGTSIEAQIAEWLQDGLIEDAKDVSEKHYSDAVVQVLDGTLEGEIIVCSIAPSSVQKLFGYMRGLVYKQLNLKDVVTEISVGKTVKPTKNPKNSYNPWAFKFSKTL